MFNHVDDMGYGIDLYWVFSGMPEDEDLRYVWAVAELERSVKESKTRRDVLQRVVGYQNEQIEG